MSPGERDDDSRGLATLDAIATARDPAVPTAEDRAVVDRMAPATARVIEAFRSRECGR